MKTDATAFDPLAFFNTPKFRAVLFYGAEKGVKDYFTTLLSRLGSLTWLSESTFLEAPLQYLTPDLFSTPQTQPMLCLEDVSDKNSSTYEALLATDPYAKLILHGPSLKTASKLVQFASKQPFVQAVGCYPLEPRQMMLLLQKAEQYLPLTWTSEAMKGLTHRVTPATLFQDLMKLSLYKGQDQGPITMDDVEVCLGDVQEESLEIAFALSARRPDLVSSLLSKAQETVEPMALLRQVLRHFMMLLQVRCALNNHKTFAEASGQLSPPLFFKKVPLFQAHVQNWSLGQIYKTLAYLEKAEMALKSAAPTYETIAYFFSQIAQSEKIL